MDIVENKIAAFGNWPLGMRQKVSTLGGNWWVALLLPQRSGRKEKHGGWVAGQVCLFCSKSVPM